VKFGFYDDPTEQEGIFWKCLTLPAIFWKLLLIISGRNVFLRKGLEE
jgi:hypothetical protein